MGARIVLPVAVALLAPAAAHAAPELTQQPQDVERPEIVRIEWAGGSSPEKGDRDVFVERQDDDSWMTQALKESEEVEIDYVGDGVWSVRWLPAYSTPSGTYRIRVVDDGHELASEKFSVSACRCVFPTPVRATWRKGRFRVSVKAEYAPAPHASFRERPTWVTTGWARVRVLREGRRVGRVRLLYRPAAGKFRGSWAGARGPRDSIVFQLVALKDAFGNS